MIKLRQIGIYCLVILWSGLLPAFAQDGTLDTLDATIIGKDTLLTKVLPQVDVRPKPRTEFKSRRQRRYYGRLLRDVKKTLPLAKVGGELMTQVNDSLKLISGKKEQKEYLKTIEEELFIEYEPALRKMNHRQGKLLIKLIDRECQMTSYEVVKVYRGNVSAFFWQGIARIFGNDLKVPYNPKGEDALIEEVVQLVEAGVI